MSEGVHEDLVFNPIESTKYVYIRSIYTVQASFVQKTVTIFGYALGDYWACFAYWKGNDRETEQERLGDLH